MSTHPDDQPDRLERDEDDEDDEALLLPDGEADARLRRALATGTLSEAEPEAHEHGHLWATPDDRPEHRNRCVICGMHRDESDEPTSPYTARVPVPDLRTRRRWGILLGITHPNNLDL